MASNSVGMLGSEATGPLLPGTEVQIEGLVNAAHLNGMKAVIIEFDPDGGRYRVHCQDDSNIALRPQNFRLVSTATAAPSPAPVAAPIGAQSAAASLGPILGPPESDPVAINLSSEPPTVPQTRRSNTALFEKLGIDEWVMYDVFPLLTKTTIASGLWLTLLTVLLVYAPR
ncbi:unnamed protein product [Amoebophrya sp. A25]|nr:unnamed protein product [Amoebophrya sp. A25]|eukprot:GSA25T00007179001.1